MERIQNLHKEPYSVNILNPSLGGSFFPVLISTLCVVLPKHQTQLETAMPSGSKSKSRNGKGTGKPTLNSIYASYGWFGHFLHSFGLKSYNTDEVEEGLGGGQEHLTKAIEFLFAHRRFTSMKKKRERSVLHAFCCMCVRVLKNLDSLESY